ncbi:MAG: J domain-containing protein [Chloroflexi bacterium]|nr:J domain-containing protein [Chloroflexota bacterium]
MPANHYEILGIERSATYTAIRDAYRRLARELHPDVSDASDAEERFKQINEAYDVLRDPRTRADYDVHLLAQDRASARQRSAEDERQRQQAERERQRQREEAERRYREQVERRQRELQERREREERVRRVEEERRRLQAEERLRATTESEKQRESEPKPEPQPEPAVASTASEAEKQPAPPDPIPARQRRPIKTIVALAVGAAIALLLGALGIVLSLQPDEDGPDMVIQTTPDVGATISAAVASAFATAAPPPAQTTEAPVVRAISPTTAEFSRAESPNAAPATAALSELTAAAAGAPASHDGTNPFTFELHFSRGLPLNYTTLQDHAFAVDGGEVTRARRLEEGSNTGWEIHVQPGSDGSVTVVLPISTDCAVVSAICAEDGQALSNRLEVVVPGPGN